MNKEELEQKIERCNSKPTWVLDHIYLGNPDLINGHARCPTTRWHSKLAQKGCRGSRK